MKLFKNYFLVFPIISILMLFMISDYKVLCNLVGSACSMALIALTIGNYNNEIFDEKNTKFYALFLLYYTLTSLFAFNFYSWVTYLLIYITLFIPFLILRFIIRINDVFLAKLIVSIFFVIWTAFCLISIKSSLEFPDIARLMCAYRPEFKDVINGGGYPMGYGAAILSAYLYYRLINGQVYSKYLKIIIVVELAIMFYMVTLINSFIILLSLLAGYVAVSINRFVNSRNKHAMYLGIAAFALIGYLLMGPFLQFMMSNTENDFWRKRWTETYYSLYEGKNSNHIDDRQERYDISLYGISESPIIGNGYRNGNGFDGDSVYIGNHSTLLDSLAQYGIIGSLPLFLYLLYPYRRNKRLGLDSSYLVPYGLMAVLNPIFNFFHVTVILFLIIPLLQYIQNDNRW